MTTSLKRENEFTQDEFDLAQVGSRVRSLRQSAGYSIEDLAETCGLTTAEITGIEEGLEADMAQLRRIAPALQASLTSLIEG
jgi:transcriptional regulator with XRE-family HTH domain